MKPFTPAERLWLSRHGWSAPAIAAQEATGTPFIDLLGILLGMAPQLLAMIQAFINMWHVPTPPLPPTP